MNYPLLIGYIANSFLLIASPGPVVMLITSISPRHGRRPAVLAALGCNAASLVWIALAALVLGGLLSLNATLLDLVTLLGSLFIAHLGISLLRPQGGAAPSTPIARPCPAPFWQGLLVGLANPKDILFFTAFFPQFLQVTSSPLTSLPLLTGLWVLCDLGLLSAYILAGRGRFLQRHDMLIARICGAVLLGFSLLALIRSSLRLGAAWP